MELSERQKLYEDVYDHRIMPRVPVIIRIDGKNFSRVTSKLERPFCQKLTLLMGKTMLESIKHIEGAVFGYHQSDEITIVLRNDQSNESQPWFANRIQKMVSVSSSIVTYHFNKFNQEMQDGPNLIGPVFFDSRVFAVPSEIEMVNNLIFRQKDCFRNAVMGAARKEFSVVMGTKTADKFLEGKSSIEKIALMNERLGINFHTKYPSAFINGTGVYRIPKEIESADGVKAIRKSWALNFALPDFLDDKSFLLDIYDGVVVEHDSSQVVG